jgi:hypothetical protein
LFAARYRPIVPPRIDKAKILLLATLKIVFERGKLRLVELSTAKIVTFGSSTRQRSSYKTSARLTGSAFTEKT